MAIWTNAANMEMKVVAIKMSARMYEIYRAMNIYTVQLYADEKLCVQTNKWRTCLNISRLVQEIKLLDKINKKRLYNYSCNFEYIIVTRSN